MLSRIVDQSLQFEYYDGGPPDDAPPGITTGWRTLPFLVFSASTDGEFVLHVKGQPDAVIGTGAGWLVPAGVTHKVDVGARRAWSMWCHMNYTVMGTVDFVSYLDVPRVLSAEQTAPLADACLELVSLDKAPPPNPLQASSRRKELGFRFLTHLIEVSKLRSERIDILISTRTIEPVLRYIQHHVAEDLTIQKLAAIACRSRSGLHQAFREIMGKAPMQFVRDIRIRSAQLLLAGSDLRVGEIGQRVGYPDPFHFSRTFKASSGLSPSRFRLEQRRGLWGQGRPPAMRS